MGIEKVKFYRINLITNKDKDYGGFINHYEPYQEIRDFRRTNKSFIKFSNTPIVFERDKSYKNDKPISDFLVTNWSELIVSERIYKMLKEKYSNEIDFYECFAKDENVLKPYFILRAKNKIDVLDKSLYPKIDFDLGVMRSVLIDDVSKEYNYFDVLYGSRMVISKHLYEELKAMSPTNFEVTPIMTTSEELKAREKNLGKIN